MEFQMLELVNLDPHVVHDPQPAHALDKLLLLESVRRAGHHVNLDPALLRPDQALDDHGILVALILHKQSVLGLVNESRHSLPSVASAPYELGLGARLELFSMPIRFETVHNFGHL